ncbi:glycosyl transferase (plasmid) [Pedobacter sp. BS3]|uniref:glycosyl transferase n=1 Tax=Pedobacter sp. BS3 TaxID=2567937 RepID=UPI0011ED346E|nr:glycosyl transferase [Pedobacter sp. BS3]TZF85914.1 glycosyl transferase [Pedobacter sp. BS3]
MLNFCTLFDSNYLSRGLTMYRSLEKYCHDYHLYIFAFDSKCYDILSNLNLAKATVISLAEFEDQELLEVKKKRTSQEYCWTCTPSTILYCINKFSLDHCTYIDADLLFFSDPKVLVDEMGPKSVMISEHRYTPEYDQTKKCGKYCVQFMTFKNNPEGMHVLNWWKNACMEWCHARFEDNKFGDQKYLDNWMEIFDCVHELKHLGGGVAPWNVQQYHFEKKNGRMVGKELSTNKEFDLVFYHFQDFRRSINNIYQIASWYHFSKDIIRSIYEPYIRTLSATEREIIKVSGWKPVKVETEISWLWKSVRKTFLVFFKGHYKNHYHLSYFYRVWLN